VYADDELGGDPLLSTEYYEGDGLDDPANARRALWCVASDALALRTVAAPTDALDLEQERVRAAVHEFAEEYEHPTVGDALETYVASVEAARAFEAVDQDPSEIFEALEGSQP
jgi:hypothetical protein